MAMPEKYSIQNKSLRDVFKEDFLESVSTSDGELFPVNVMFIHIHKTEKGERKSAFPIVMSHGNDQEVKDKKLHVESSNQEMLEKFTKALENKKSD